MSITAKPYIYYDTRIYPKIKDRRGATRLKKLLEKLSWVGLEKIEEEPVPLRKKEFDNLLILDACRYDIYEELYGETQKRVTMGSMSMEYIRKNFSDTDFSDTVYITANPYFHESRFENLTGRKPEEVFHTVFHTYQGKWDDGENTVLPGSLVEDALTAEKLFPEKKKIVHFMQPHLPFIGSEFGDFDMKQAILSDTENEKIWTLAMKGEINQEKIIEAYKDNLKLVKNEADRLAEQLYGKTIITADHGTFLGEKGLYKHPDDSNVKILREVPWDEF